MKKDCMVFGEMMVSQYILNRFCWVFVVMVCGTVFVYGADSVVSYRSDSEYMVGINLGGAEFGGVIPGVEGVHYGWPTVEELDYWQSKGIQLIRLPFLWERLQPALNGAFDRDYLAGLEDTVKMMGQRNMFVILDVHNYAKYHGELIGTDAVPLAAFGDLWRRLADVFKDNPAVYGYGLMNEPGPCDWASAAQVAIDAIRQVDMATRIYVANDYPAWAATYATGDLAVWAEKKMPIGNPKMLHDPSNLLRWELHVYLDHDASGKYKHTYQHEIDRTDGPGARVGPDIGVKRVKPFVEWLNKYDQIGFIGEYSAPANPGVDRRWLLALKNTMDYFQENGLANTYWAAGKRFTSGQGYVISQNGWPPKLKEGGGRPQLKLLRKYIALSNKMNQKKLSGMD